ncbi:MAG: hypothetical protein WBN96_03815, partial [Gammaproteobacteria bacterium]
MKHVNLMNSCVRMIISNNIKLSWLAGLLLLQGTAQAADLVEILQAARQHDPVYAAAQSTWAATQEKLPQARALLQPEIA